MCNVCTSSHVCPSMHWAGGMCIPACTGQRGVCIPACTGWGGVCPGVSSQGGVCPGGVCIPACTEADTPLWTEWLTDRCKNITFPHLRLRTVKITFLCCVVSEKCQINLIIIYWCFWSWWIFRPVALWYPRSSLVILLKG